MSRFSLIFLIALAFVLAIAAHASAQDSSDVVDIEALVREVLEEELEPLPMLIEEEQLSSDDARYIERLDDDDFATTCTVTTGLNVRSGPGTNYAKLGLLNQGHSVSRISTSGQWSKINYNGKNAWVHSDYLRCSGTGGGSGGGSTGGSTCSRSFPLFKQCDGKWGSDKLGSSSTICKVGCLMSSVSMALAAKGKSVGGSSASPKSLNAWLRSNGGYSGNLFVWGSVGAFGFSYQGKSSNHSDIKSKVCNGSYAVILNVNGGGHWVLATGVNSDGSYKVNDPGYSRSSYTTGQVVTAAIYRI